MYHAAFRALDGPLRAARRWRDNALLVASDGVQARMGPVGAGKEWFKPWRTIAGGDDAPGHLSELQVMLQGVFARERFLPFLRHFIVFEDQGGGKLAKKVAGYHQFHAVNVAVEETLRAAGFVADDRVAETAGRFHAGRQAGGRSVDRRAGVARWRSTPAG